MKCAACGVTAHVEFERLGIWKSPDYFETVTAYSLAYGTCPACGHALVIVRRGKYDNSDGPKLKPPITEHVIFPFTINRPLPAEVPAAVGQEFDEAAAVLTLSPRASAALSRRILQYVLRDHLALTQRDLAQQIEAFLLLPNIPTYLAGAVDAIRHVGNLAAHPTKYAQSGEIVAVEPGEAEWLLQVLERLFDFVFVQPAKLAMQREDLNAKLSSAGKPPLK